MGRTRPSGVIDEIGCPHDAHVAVPVLVEHEGGRPWCRRTGSCTQCGIDAAIAAATAAIAPIAAAHIQNSPPKFAPASTRIPISTIAMPATDTPAIGHLPLNSTSDGTRRRSPRARSASRRPRSADCAGGVYRARRACPPVCGSAHRLHPRPNSAHRPPGRSDPGALGVRAPIRLDAAARRVRRPSVLRQYRSGDTIRAL